jgi:predicted RNA-binding protein with TRAM domain
MLIHRELADLDKYLTQLPDEGESPFIEETEVLDSFGDQIDDEDAVFELTFTLYEPDFEMGEIVAQEITRIVTQLNIADCIEENESKSLKHIEFVGFGKQYKEMEKSK